MLLNDLWAHCQCVKVCSGEQLCPCLKSGETAMGELMPCPDRQRNSRYKITSKLFPLSNCICLPLRHTNTMLLTPKGQYLMDVKPEHQYHWLQFDLSYPCLSSLFLLVTALGRPGVPSMALTALHRTNHVSAKP